MEAEVLCCYIVFEGAGDGESKAAGDFKPEMSFFPYRGHVCCTDASGKGAEGTMGGSMGVRTDDYGSWLAESLFGKKLMSNSFTDIKEMGYLLCVDK